jgi:hypothetical protein
VRGVGATLKIAHGQKVLYFRNGWFYILPVQIESPARILIRPKARQPDAQSKENTMRKVIVILLFAAFAVVGLAPYNAVASGQKKAAAGAKEMRWDGHIVRIDKDTSYMDVRNRAGVEKRIYWSSSTTWTKLNKPVADHSEFKEDKRVICLGNVDEKGAFHATRIDLRVHP